ncbi:uncharacterized protein LOC134772052 [Penaeus indicus]|uniref:uncharacterized protein LOC134772052 n=1 Tax=Penaeus indicus TaxID=29960 RepID=UPI00300C15A8
MTTASFDRGTTTEYDRCRHYYKRIDNMLWLRGDMDLVAPPLQRWDDTSRNTTVLRKTPTNATRRTVLREQNQNTLKNTTVQKFAKKDGTLSSNDISTYSHFSDGIQRRSERENIRSSTVHGANKTPLLVCRPSPRRPPPGLPKTPKTLPRVATRRSPRFSAPRTSRHSPRSTTVSRMVSPASSSTFKSPRAGTPRATTPNRWSKLSFLI